MVRAAPVWLRAALVWLEQSRHLLHNECLFSTDGLVTTAGTSVENLPILHYETIWNPRLAHLAKVKGN